MASPPRRPSSCSEIAAFSPLSEFFTSWAISDAADPSAAMPLLLRGARLHPHEGAVDAAEEDREEHDRAELEQSDHGQLPQQPTPRRRDDAILVGREHESQARRPDHPGRRELVAAAEREQRALRLGEQALDQTGRSTCETQSGGCSGRKMSPAAFVTSSWSFATSSCQPGSVSEDAFRKPASAPAIASPFRIGTPMTKRARARPGGIEDRRPARQQLLEPAMVAQAHAALERARRLAPDRPAVAVEHRDTHAEERGSVVGGFEEHLLGGAGAVEQVHLGALRQPLEVALEQLQVETQRLRVHLRLARHAQLQLLADGRDVGPVAEHGARQGDEAGHRQPGDHGARELPGAGDHARGRRSAGSHGGHVP